MRGQEQRVQRPGQERRIGRTAPPRGRARDAEAGQSTRPHPFTTRIARGQRDPPLDAVALEPGGNSVGCDKRVIVHSGPHHAPLLALHKTSGGGRTRIVSRCHDRAIGAGAAGSPPDRPTFSRGQARPAAKISEVSQTGPDHVIARAAAPGAGSADRHDFVMGIVEGRADQIVHARIEDEECLGFALLDVDHARHQHARHWRRSAGRAQG